MTRRQRGIAGEQPRVARVPSACLALLLFANPGTAQVYESVDEQGTRHFTNSLKSLPEGARGEARLFVEKGPMSKMEDDSPMSKAGPSAARDAESAASIAWDDEAAASDEKKLFDDAWTQGWEAGLEQPGPLPPTEPPVIILQVPPPIVVEVPAQPYDPAGLYYRPNSEGRMSEPFDGGRSRGLTHRQHLQERRRIDSRP